MPRHLQPPRPGDILRSPLQHLPHPPMQVLPGGPRHRIVRLRANQLVPELEPTVHLAENPLDRKSTRLNSSHSQISYAVFCLKKKKIVNYIPNNDICTTSMQ